MTALDSAQRTIHFQPPYDIRRETIWQYERRLAEAALDAAEIFQQEGENA